MTTEQIKQIVIDAANKYGINPAIALAQIQAESSFNPNAHSPKGAQGLAQFMPATARQYGLANPFDAKQSMEAWGKFMTYLLKKFNFDYKLALAAYNAGEGNVTKYKGVPPFKETQNYVNKIMTQAGLNVVTTVPPKTETTTTEAPKTETPEKKELEKKPQPFEWTSIKPEHLALGLIVLFLVLSRD